MEDQNNQILIYESVDGSVSVDVTMENDTLWLSQKRMSELFWVNSDTISDHIQIIYKEGELTMGPTTGNFPVVQKEGNRMVKREIQFYNLDMIIAVGYRVNSKKATQFRIRSTNVLKQYIVHGYALNQQRLEQTGLDEIKKSLELLKRALDNIELSTDESRGLLELMTQYIPSLITLHRYDSDDLVFTNLNNEERYSIDKDEALQVLHELKRELLMKGEASELFAMDRADGLDAIFGALYQSFDGADLYQSIEEKAAHLLYLIIKNHPFVDGNKRSGAFLFVWYLNRNAILKKEDGTHKISESSLVALALLVAMSKPSEKEHIVKLVMALIV